MEKYRIFADEGTGCNPFVPTYFSQKQLRASSSRSKIQSLAVLCLTLPLYPLLLLLAAARLLLLLLALIMAGLLLLPLFMLRLLPYVHWQLQRVLLQLPIRLVFFALGFHWIAEETAGDFGSLLLSPSLCISASCCTCPSPSFSLFAALSFSLHLSLSVSSPGLCLSLSICLCQLPPPVSAPLTFSVRLRFPAVEASPQAREGSLTHLLVSRTPGRNGGGFGGPPLPGGLRGPWKGPLPCVSVSFVLYFFC